MYYKDYDKFKNQKYNYKVRLKNEIDFRLEDIKRRLDFYKDVDELELIVNEIKYRLHWENNIKKINKVMDYCNYIDTLLPLHQPIDFTPIRMLRRVEKLPMVPYFPKLNYQSLQQAKSKLHDLRQE